MKDPVSNDSVGATASASRWPLSDMTDKFKALAGGADLTYLDPQPAAQPMGAATQWRRTVLGSTHLQH